MRSKEGLKVAVKVKRTVTHVRFQVDVDVHVHNHQPILEKIGVSVRDSAGSVLIDMNEKRTEEFATTFVVVTLRASKKVSVRRVRV